MKRKFMYIALLLAIVASIIGISAIKAEAAGSPKVARCFTEQPTIKGVTWQASSDYFWGLAPSPSTDTSVLEKFEWDFKIRDFVKPNGRPAASKVFMTFIGASKAYVCYESYIWSQHIDEYGNPMFYDDGQPMLYQRVVSSYWKKVNPRSDIFAWDFAYPRLGGRGIFLTAWVIGGK